ncbi:MAG TPA: hypothetical protein VIS94_02005 [Desulfomonilia bacterium]
METPDAFKVFVLDIDGAVTRQERLMARYQPAVIPYLHKSEALRYWCSLTEIEQLRDVFTSSAPSSGRKVIFYGSGDYHHLAFLWISLIKEPATVIHFDDHSDFWKTPNRNFIHFGCWVVNTLKLPNIRKVIQLGVDGDFDMNLETPFPMGPIGHVMRLLHDGRIEVYPNSMRRSLLLGRIKGRLPCVEFEPGLLTSQANWKNMRDNGGIEATLESVLPRITTDAVYLTIDKDCLRESDNFAAYPGRQGTMALEELLSAITFIGKRKRILGADVCGDGSLFPASGNRLKRMVAWIKDHDIPLEEFSSPKNILLNEDANLKIMERLNSTDLLQ